MAAQESISVDWFYLHRNVTHLCCVPGLLFLLLAQLEFLFLLGGAGGREDESLSQEGGWLHKVWKPQTTFVLTSRSGKGTPRLQGTEILEPSSSCPRVSGSVSLLASDQGGRHLSPPASCTGSAGHLLWHLWGHVVPVCYF